MTFDHISVIASCIAVLVAVAALILGASNARQDREFGRLIERQKAMTDLLAAFEAMRAFDVPLPIAGDPEKQRTLAESQPSDFELVRARYRAHLYASAEALPITRGLTFPHIPVPPPDNARREGNPEADSDEVRVVRGEFLDSLDALRSKIYG